MARLLALNKYIKILEKQLVFVYLSFILSLATILSATSLEYQKHVFSNNCWRIYLLHISLKNLAGQLLLVKAYYTRQWVSFKNTYIVETLMKN